MNGESPLPKLFIIVDADLVDSSVPPILKLVSLKSSKSSPVSSANSSSSNHYLFAMCNRGNVCTTAVLWSVPTATKNKIKKENKDK